MSYEIEIEVAQNGFVMKYDDPETVAQNRSSEGGWVDPCKQMVYPTADALLSALSKILPVIAANATQEQEPGESFSDMLKAALNQTDDEIND